MAAKSTHFRVGNGDMTLIKLGSGRCILIDINVRTAADDTEDSTPDVAKQTPMGSPTHRDCDSLFALIRGGGAMAGRSPVKASEQERTALEVLAASRERGEADRARAVLLTLNGWTSARIAEAFGVREDTVRLWRGDFMRGGIAALKASVAPGPPPLKTEAALRVIAPLLDAPVANRPNWTIPRLMAEIEAREGIKIGRSQLSNALRKKTSAGGGRGTR
jgi:transposase